MEEILLKSTKKVLAAPLRFPLTLRSIQWYRAVSAGPMVKIGIEQSTKRRLHTTTSPILFNPMLRKLSSLKRFMSIFLSMASFLVLL